MPFNISILDRSDVECMRICCEGIKIYQDWGKVTGWHPIKSYPLEQQIRDKFLLLQFISSDVILQNYA